MIPPLARVVVDVAPLAPAASRQEAHTAEVQPLMVTRSVVALEVQGYSAESITVENVGDTTTEGTLWVWYRHSFGG